MNNIVAVDLDGTICKWSGFPDIGEPEPEVKKYLQEIKELGFEIHIYTCRTSRELFKYPIDIKEQVKKIKNYLEEHEIPYDEILIVDKPIVKFYIDDSAIRYNGSWKDVVEEMKERIQ